METTNFIAYNVDRPVPYWAGAGLKIDESGS